MNNSLFEILSSQKDDLEACSSVLLSLFTLIPRILFKSLVLRFEIDFQNKEMMIMLLLLLLLSHFSRVRPCATP